jgi:hypothetical protein
MSDESRRISAILIPRAQEALDLTVKRMGLSKTDVINRALQAYAFLEEEMTTGATVLVRRDGVIEEVRFL